MKQLILGAWFLILVINTTSAQTNIRKLILEDWMRTDAMYDSMLLSNFVYWYSEAYINSNYSDALFDSLFKVGITDKTPFTIVRINQKYMLNGNMHYNLEYILYTSFDNQVKKVNGFCTSEVLDVPNDDLDDIGFGKLARILKNGSYCQINRWLQKNLKISILKGFEVEGQCNVGLKPIIIDPFIKYRNTVHAN